MRSTLGGFRIALIEARRLDNDVERQVQDPKAFRAAFRKAQQANRRLESVRGMLRVFPNEVICAGFDPLLSESDSECKSKR